MAEASSFVSEGPGDYALGSVIGDKYRLERPLGEGGQAWVWQGRHIALDGRVAIKIMRTDNVDPAERVHAERLLQEARAAAQLGHPAIVRVFDVGTTSAGDAYLVMELLEGISLGDRLVQDSRLPPTEAVRTLLPIADALVVAHSIGVVHRDLKPDNVFLAQGPSGVQPKLLDFGVAKVQPGLRQSGQLTDTGAVVGSPAYLSPEQARGRSDIDQRVDVWSFSAMLYECVTGDLPFHGPNYNALLRSIVEDEPPSIVPLGAGDERLWAILRRGLHKSRDERWPSMMALGQELARWLKSQGVSDDVCGVSLKFRWLRPGATPPSASVPSSDPSTPSVSGSSLEDPRQSLTLRSGSSSLPVEASPAAPSRSRIALGAAALAAAIGIGWLAVRFGSSAPANDPLPGDETASAAVPAAPSASAPTTGAPVVVPLPGPAPAPSAQPLASGAPASIAPIASAKSAPRRAPSAVPPAARAAAPAALPGTSSKSPAPRNEASDLLNPY